MAEGARLLIECTFFVPRVRIPLTPLICFYQCSKTNRSIFFFLSLGVRLGVGFVELALRGFAPTHGLRRAFEGPGKDFAPAPKLKGREIDWSLESALVN